MSFLFTVDNKMVVPTTETLLIEPYSTIWERDTSPKKERAMKEFAFIEFMSSMKKTNPYKGYSESLRFEKICKEVIRDDKWKPDAEVMKGIAELTKFQTEASITYSYFTSVRKATEELKKFLTTINLSERNFKTGVPVYKPKEVTTALVDTEKVLANLNALQSKVEEELYDAVRNKADKEISPFASASSFL